MPIFTYKARAAGDQTVEGVIDAESQSAAVRQLGMRGVYPVAIARRDAGPAAEAASAAGGRVPISAISACLRQLSDLLEAGLPLASVMSMAAQQATHPRLQAILTAMTAGVQEGRTLSRLMGEHPEVFPAFYTQLVYAGETGGLLSTVLARLADYAEREEETRAQIKAALAYPSFIVLVGALTIAFLLGAIIPKLGALFTDFQQNLPLPTRILLEISLLFRQWGWLLLPLSWGVWRLLRETAKDPKWALARDRWLLRIPVVKTWVLHREIGQFTRTLGSLLENGVPVLQAMRVSAQTLGNRVFAEKVLALEGPVREGVSVSQGLRRAGLFPPYVCNLVAVGEEGGKLDQALLKIAGTYDRQTQRDLKMAMSLLEPSLILGIGLVLGAVVISIMLPIFEINTLIH